VAGGEAGGPNWFTVIRKGKEIAPSDTPGRVQGFRLLRDDVVCMRTAGGGGYGDPLERDPERVAGDVAFGYVSREAAQRSYGVVLGSGGVDVAATQALRERRRRERLRVRVTEAGGEATAGAGRSWIEASRETLADIGVAAGSPCEVADPSGPSLRLWAREAADLARGNARIGRGTCAMLGVEAGEEIAVRPLAADKRGAGR
jgi:N-methylhydantoinase B